MDGKLKHLDSYPTGEAAARIRCGCAHDPRPQAQLSQRQQRGGNSTRAVNSACLHLQARLPHSPAPNKPRGKRSPPHHEAGHRTSYHQCAPHAMSRTTEMALLLLSRRFAGASALASHVLCLSAPRAKHHMRALRLCLEASVYSRRRMMSTGNARSSGSLLRMAVSSGIDETGYALIGPSEFRVQVYHAQGDDTCPVMVATRGCGLTSGCGLRPSSDDARL
jgi:hypothetical protein